MAKPKRIYLAGPEVFFPAGEHQAIITTRVVEAGEVALGDEVQACLGIRQTEK